jgi:GGDEF domain-containing protein
VLLENISAAQAVAAAEKLRKAIEDMTICCQGQSVGVTVSIGAAHCSAKDSQTLDCLLMQRTGRCTFPKAEAATEPACAVGTRQLYEEHAGTMKNIAARRL